MRKIVFYWLLTVIFNITFTQAFAGNIQIIYPVNNSYVSSNKIKVIGTSTFSRGSIIRVYIKSSTDYHTGVTRVTSGGRWEYYPAIIEGIGKQSAVIFAVAHGIRSNIVRITKEAPVYSPSSGSYEWGPTTISWQPPLLPVEVSYDSENGVQLHIKGSIWTPIGVFSISKGIRYRRYNTRGCQIITVVDRDRNEQKIYKAPYGKTIKLIFREKDLDFTRLPNGNILIEVKTSQNYILHGQRKGKTVFKEILDIEDISKYNNYKAIPHSILYGRSGYIYFHNIYNCQIPRIAKFWNPRNSTYNVIEWYDENSKEHLSFVEWRVRVKKPGKIKIAINVWLPAWSRGHYLEVYRPDTVRMFKKKLLADDTVKIIIMEMYCPMRGVYRVRFKQEWTGTLMANVGESLLILD